jgi:TonB family protein
MAVDFKGNGPLYRNSPRMLPPFYPPVALKRRVEATAVVAYVIGVDGHATVEEIGYEDDSSHRSDGIDDALREWVKGMRYEPEQLAGHPVRTRLRVPVVFMPPGSQSRASYRKEIREKAVKSEECRLAAGEALPEGLQPVVLNSPVRLDPAG